MHYYPYHDDSHHANPICRKHCTFCNIMCSLSWNKKLWLNKVKLILSLCLRIFSNVISVMKSLMLVLYFTLFLVSVNSTKWNWRHQMGSNTSHLTCAHREHASKSLAHIARFAKLHPNGGNNWVLHLIVSCQSILPYIFLVSWWWCSIFNFFHSLRAS
jgi:hypothetical protein